MTVPFPIKGIRLIRKDLVPQFDEAMRRHHTELDDALQPLLGLGTSTIRRVSHVEPTPEGLWTADLSPVGGPLLGPFRLRGQAIEAEREWLE